jgi:membrane-associated phospholipid phosphatase
MCAISLIIYIAYPTYAIRYQEFSGQHNATLFGEMPSYHIMNTMILFVSCIPTKKTKGQIILCVFTLCLFIAVMPLSIYTNRHFLIDVIVGVSIVLFVQIFFTLFKTPKFDKKLFNFFEIVIPAKFQWKRKGVSIKYFLAVIPFFLLLGALNITMEFFTNIN